MVTKYMYHTKLEVISSLNRFTLTTFESEAFESKPRVHQTKTASTALILRPHST